MGAARVASVGAAPPCPTDRNGNFRANGVPLLPVPDHMALTLDDVRRLAHLARIHITHEQSQATLAQLTDIFAMIERMQQVDTAGVEPMAHPLGGSQRLREDRVTELQTPAAREENMKNAPAQADGLFLVPRVIE